RFLRTARNRRRPDQSPGDVSLHEGPTACGGSDQQLYDRRNRRDQRVCVLGTRRCAHGHRRAPGGRRFCRIAAGCAHFAQSAIVLHFALARGDYRLAGRADDLQIAHRRISMSRQDVAADRVLSLTLKAGAYTAFALIAAGLALRWATPAGGKIVSAGLLVLL